MKKLLLLSVTIFICTSTFAQNSGVPSKFKVRSFGISFGSEMDMLDGLDHNYLMSTAKNSQQSVFNPSGGNAGSFDYYGAVCENPYVRFTVGLDVPGVKNGELNLSAVGVFNRLDGTTYTNSQNEYISYNSFSNEIAAEATLDKRFTLCRSVNFYLGAGTNIGYIYGGELTIEGNTNVENVDEAMNRSFSDIVAGKISSENTYEFYEQKDGLNQRLFAHFGFGLLVLKRIELGLDVRCGIGYRAIGGAETKTTSLNSSGLSLKWILN